MHTRDLGEKRRTSHIGKLVIISHEIVSLIIPWERIIKAKEENEMEHLAVTIKN